mmetsp:Transcript_33359/g.79800  ORF Transcript_33359/g.79800 Transcript_33359/m.79800 type:complete len:244 (-) Transcript_33359:526-1257(-)
MWSGREKTSSPPPPSSACIPSVPIRLAVRLISPPPATPPPSLCARYAGDGPETPSSLSRGDMTTNRASSSGTLPTPLPLSSRLFTSSVATARLFSQGRNSSRAAKSGMPRTSSPIDARGTLSISSSAAVALSSMSILEDPSVPPPMTTPRPRMLAALAARSVPSAAAQLPTHLAARDGSDEIDDAYRRRQSWSRTTSRGGILSPLASQTRPTMSSNMSKDWAARAALTADASASSASPILSSL